MLFLNPPARAEDIRAFCATFNEGIRVEYKRNFDENVRRNLPKVISSFANSLGGVLVIGVEANDGAPQQPIQGFDRPAEEFALTVENICLQNINPPVLPRIHVVPSDVAGRIFAVVEVDESAEAPHAIENSKRVYVRTGNAANPYDTADVDLIIDLVRRRVQPTKLRERIIGRAAERAEHALRDASPIQAEFSVVPTYPARPVTTRDEIWDFLNEQYFRGAHLFPFRTLRRIEDGVGSFGAELYGQVNVDGLVFVRSAMQQREQRGIGNYLLVADVFHPFLKALVCASRLYTHTGFKGNLHISATMRNIRGHRMFFLGGVELANLGEGAYIAVDQTVTSSQTIAAQHLSTSLVQTLIGVIGQLCWSFWQDAGPFPGNEFDGYIRRTLQQMGVEDGRRA